MALPETEIWKKYAEMIKSLEKNISESLHKQEIVWNERLNAGEKQFHELQKYYSKGHEELIVQLQKANGEMIQKLIKNCDQLKQDLKQNYSSILNQSKVNFSKHIEMFKQSCEEAVKKVPTLSPKIHEDAIKDLLSTQGKTLDSIAKSYKAMLDRMDQSFQQTSNQLKLPQPKPGPSTPPAQSRQKGNRSKEKK